MCSLQPLTGCYAFTAKIKLLPKSGTVRVGYNPFLFLCTATFPARIESLEVVDKKGTVLPDKKEGKSGDILIAKMVNCSF